VLGIHKNLKKSAKAPNSDSGPNQPRGYSNVQGRHRRHESNTGGDHEELNKKNKPQIPWKEVAHKLNLKRDVHGTRRLAGCPAIQYFESIRNPSS